MGVLTLISTNMVLELFLKSLFLSLLLAQHSSSLTCVKCSKGAANCVENVDIGSNTVACGETSKGCQITEFSVKGGRTYERKCSPPDAKFECVAEPDPHEDSVTTVCNCNGSDNCNQNLCTAGIKEHTPPCQNSAVREYINVSSLVISVILFFH